MKCQQCGYQNTNDAHSCKSCGGKLSGPTTTLKIPEVPSESMSGSRELAFDDFALHDRFKIKRKLGKGGMGTIFHSRDLKLKRDVAIKCISEETLSDAVSKARFLREAQTASQLEHANICTIYEIYEEEKNNYIVMQYIDGVTLDHIISLKKLGINKILDIGIQICDGMIEAHSKGIIHRDIKPANIMVDQKGKVKLLDFGLAKFRDESMLKMKGREESFRLTEKGFLMGTVCYMSPEQARGEKLGFGSDIFSVGTVLFEMLEGMNPFQDKDHICTLYNVINKKIEFTPDIPVALKKIVMRALEKECGDRYPNFREMKEDLEKFRVAYNQQKEEARGSKTEIIAPRDKEEWIKKLQKTSDKEGLGEIVYRIKKIKAQTEPLKSTRKRLVKFIFIPLVLVAAVLALVLPIWKKNNALPVPGPGKKFFIYLHGFENQTGEMGLSEQLNYLLNESLNQFQEFKTIDRNIATGMETVINQANSGNSAEFQETDSRGTYQNSDRMVSIIDSSRADPPSRLTERFNLVFDLRGVFSKFNDFYNIDAVLSPLSGDRRKYPITVPVKDKDALLDTQLDALTRRVYLSIFSTKNSQDIQVKKMSGIFGNRWETFVDYFRGMQYHRKLQFSKAEYHLTRSIDLAVAKYLLSDLYYFKGKREEAMKLILEIMPQLNQLTESLQLQVLALKSRLDFDFRSEITHLEQLKKAFPFRVDVFFELGEAYFHRGKAKQAIPYYQQALDINQKYSKAINHLGYCYSYLGDHNRAIQLFEDYRNLDHSANSFDSLGDGYFYAGDLVSAEALKLAAVSMDSQGVPWSLLTLADIYIVKAEYRKVAPVLKQYDEVLPSKKELARSLATRAYRYYVEQEYKTALALLDQSISTYNSKDINDYTVAEAHWLRGLVLLALNRLDECRRELFWLSGIREQYNLSENNFYIPLKFMVHLQALIAEKDNHVAEADNRFLELLNLKSQLSYWVTPYHYQFFHTEYIKYLIRQKKLADALSEADRCLEFNKNYIPCLWEKAFVLEYLGRLDEAVPLYERLNDLYGESTEKNRFRTKLKQKLSSIRLR